MKMYIIIKSRISALNSYFLTSSCPKIEILKQIPEDAETEEGLKRELQVLRYTLYSYDYFIFLSF